MKLKGATVAVTGASGMLGVYICRELIATGAKVIGVVRNLAKASFLENEGAELVHGELLDEQSLRKVFVNCDAIVSNAALYSLRNTNYKENYQANKTGTENVFKAASELGITRIVQISTVGLYQFNLFSTLDENSAQVNGEKQEGGAYRATKQISESIAWQMAARLNLKLTTLRPSAIYGARDQNLMPGCYAAMKLPILILPQFHWPLVHAADVATAVKNCLENEDSIGQAYNTSGDDYSFVDFFHAFKSVAGKNTRIYELPLSIGQKISNRKAKREIGFANRSFARGLSEIFAEEPEKLL